MKKRLDLILPIIIIAVSVIAELLLGNFVYFAHVSGRNQTVDFRPEVQKYSVTLEENQLYFDNLGFGLNSVELTIRNVDYSSPQDFVTVGVYTHSSAESVALSLATSRRVPFAHFESTKTLYCNSESIASGVLLTFDDFEGEIEVTSLTFNPEYKLQFDAMRFGFILLIGTVIYLHKSRPENPTLSYKSRHKRSLSAGVAACVGCTLAVIIFNGMGEGSGLIEYPLIKGVDAYDPYIQQFDAYSAFLSAPQMECHPYR